MKNSSEFILSLTALSLLATTLSLMPTSANAQNATTLDVNDISFLWPVPKTKTDAETLISLADEAADGPIMPLAVFKALMEKAKTVNVDGNLIRFPSPQLHSARDETPSSRRG